MRLRRAGALTLAAAALLSATGCTHRWCCRPNTVSAPPVAPLPCCPTPATPGGPVTPIPSASGFTSAPHFNGHLK